MAKRIKYVLLSLKETRDEHSSRVQIVQKLPVKENIKRWAEDWVSDYMGKYTHKDEGVYYFLNGEIAVRITSVKEISKDKFKILEKTL